MNDFIHGPQLSHPPDGPGVLLPQDKPLNHAMNDAVSVNFWAHLLPIALMSSREQITVQLCVYTSSSLMFSSGPVE